MISKKSKITVIGAGKIAYSLVYALKNAGYNVKTIISRNLKSAKSLAEKFSIKNYSNNLNDFNSQAKIFFLSVPDNQIKITADKLANLNSNFNDLLFIHLSGAEDVFKLNSLKKKGAITASFHIMQTFPSKRIVNIKNCYAAVETNNTYAENYLFKLSADIKLKPFKLKSENKTRYHLAGVFTSNFLVGNFFNSKKVFDIKKINKKYNNFDFLLPIIKSTLNNIDKLGSSKSLSGPIERGDNTTIKKHISTLKKIKGNSEKINDIYLNYIVQSISLLNVVSSKQKKLSKEHLELKKYLVKEFKILCEHFWKD